MTTKEHATHDDKDHAARVEELRPLAEALPATAVKEPDMPVSVYVDEGFGFVVAAREHAVALTAVGMPGELPDTLDRLLRGLQSIQVLWNKEEDKGRTEETIKVVLQATGQRGDALAASDLALRKSSEGQRRLSKIREGEGLPDMVADLFDLAQLLRDAPEPFAAIKVDAGAMAEALDKTGRQLQNSLAQEDAKKSMSSTKELRDRFYTLTLEPLRDLRAFGDFAFRKDKGNNRRFAFASAYIRRRNSRARSRAKTTEAKTTEVNDW